jgi:hypothetical protein
VRGGSGGEHFFEHLVLRASQGDRRAIAIAFGPKLLREAELCLRSYEFVAADVLQDFYLSLFENRSRFAPARGRAIPWMREAVRGAVELAAPHRVGRGLPPRSPYDKFHHTAKAPQMSRWLHDVLKRIHELAASGKVRFTLKALRELASLDAGLDETDALGILRRLRASDSLGRLRSEYTREWLYVFLPRAGGDTLYVKVLVRSDCVIISFHEQVGDEAEEEDADP